MTTELLSDDRIRALNYEDNRESLCCHFEAIDALHWTDVAAEGSRVLGLLLNLDVEEDSTLDELMTSVASRADDTAIASVAAALGVSPKALKLATATWGEQKDEPPIGPVALMEAIAEQQRGIDERAAAKAG